MEPHEETSRCFSPFLKWFALTFMYSDPYLHFVYWFWSSFVFCLSFFHQLGCIYWICVLGWFCSCIVLRVTSLSLSLCISLSLSLSASLSHSLSPSLLHCLSSAPPPPPFLPHPTPSLYLPLLYQRVLQTCLLSRFLPHKLYGALCRWLRWMVRTGAFPSA